MSRELELNREFTGLSDPAGLQAEVGTLQDQLTSSTSQLAIEREVAMDIHHARSMAITESPALTLIFKAEDDKPEDGKPDPSIDAVLSSAFGKTVSSGVLPEGFADTVARHLRTTNHPDAGGDTAVSQNIAQRLDKLKQDPNFSIASALLANQQKADADTASLRTERYRLHIALSGVQPQFDNEQNAKTHAEAEIQGAEWRVRTYAAFKLFELIIGDTDTWNKFLQSIVDARHTHLINMVNRAQPAILTLQERLAKGDPIAADDLDIPAIDAAFERIWSALGSKKGTPFAYNPPYQNWLEVLLPAMQLLDPGEKAGETYTRFEPPIRISREPSYSERIGDRKLDANFAYRSLKRYRESTNDHYDSY